MSASAIIVNKKKGHLSRSKDRSCSQNKCVNLAVNENKCTFKPEIDRKSKQIFENKFENKIKQLNLSKNEIKNFRINEMYERAKQRKQILKKLDEQIYGNFKFIPNFNTNYIVESTFNERLQYYKNKSQEKIKHLEEEKKKLEEESGQKFLSPKLISKQVNRERPKSEIFNYMYSFAQKYNSNKNLKTTEEQLKIKQNSTSVHTNNDSEMIYGKLKQQNFEKIFHLLDSDQDNLISKFAIDLKRIPNNVKNVMNVLIKEIVEDDQTLTKEEFLLAGDHLYEVIY